MKGKNYKKVVKLLYEEYSWVTHIGYCLLDILPALLRKIILKAILGQFTGGMIDRQIYFRYPKKVKIGERCAINRGCKFFASAHNKDKYNIEIGDHVLIGPNVNIFTAGHDYNTISLSDTYGKVIIENDVWIGGNATILHGVTIHEGAVIGAGSVVTKDVPSWTINVGVPARVIKKRVICNIPQ